MTHPNREDWMSFLYGETDAATRAGLQKHLRACPECAQAVQMWRGTMNQLENWTLPRASRARAEVTMPMFVKWGLAALLVMGIGIAIGRFSTASMFDVAQARAALAPVLRDQLRAELGADLRAALASDKAVNPFQEELRATFASWSELQSFEQHAQFEQVLGVVARLVQTTRAEDRRAMLAQMQKLRRDLETVAVVADAQFQQTENQLVRLVSFDQAVEPR
jgi:anti-sigma factor RsiW